MAWNGHTGIEHQEKRSVEDERFFYVLSSVRTMNDGLYLVFHIIAKNPKAITEWQRHIFTLMQLQKFSECPYARERVEHSCCFWKAFHIKERGDANQIYNAFQRLCENFAKVMDEFEQVHEVTQRVGLEFPASGST